MDYHLSDEKISSIAQKSLMIKKKIKRMHLD